MHDITDEINKDRHCNCNIRSKVDGRCQYDNNCRKATVVYELKCLICDMDYIGKTQRYVKTRTKEHVNDVWKVIDSGRKNMEKYGWDDWYGSGGYKGCDAFAKHFAQHCKDAENGNAMRAKMKEIMVPSILWQGDRIMCMKSSRTLQCNICMVERNEILSRFRDNKSSIMNDNSDIFSSCKCMSSFHKFSRTIEPTLTTRLTQKKVPSTRNSKSKRRRSSILRRNTHRRSSASPKTPLLCQPCVNTPSPTSRSTSFSSTESASPSVVTPVFLHDINVPWSPNNSPTAQPTNLQLARYRSYMETDTVLEV